MPKAFPNPAADADIIDLQPDEIAAPELAVDREIEQDEVASAALQLKPDPNSPDIFRLEGALLADQAPFALGAAPG